MNNYYLNEIAEAKTENRRIAEDCLVLDMAYDAKFKRLSRWAIAGCIGFFVTGLSLGAAFRPAESTEKIVINNKVSGKIASQYFKSPFKKQKYPASFLTAVTKTLKNEGGYNPNDSNNHPANFGINGKWYKPLNSNYPARVKDLTKPQAIEYYYVKYWQPSGIETSLCKQVYKDFIFDAAVQHGVKTSKKFHEVAQCRLHVAKELRLKHLAAWAQTPLKQRLLIGCNNRVNQYNDTV
ncbi:MAG TPA: glycosyl hydrolase 108 family protein [Vampirovibrionales bacterium]